MYKKILTMLTLIMFFSGCYKITDKKTGTWFLTNSDVKNIAIIKQALKEYDQEKKESKRVKK